MRIAVVGAGAIGGFFGARLAAAGHEVHFVARGATLAALEESGIELESPMGYLRLRPVALTDDPAAIGPVELVVVAVKAWQVPGVAPRLAPLLGTGTAVLPLQNGVEAADQLAAALGPEPVLGGVCKVIVLKTAPHRVRHVGVEPIVELGELGRPPAERVRRVARAFADAGARVATPDDVLLAIWAKFLFICAVSGVGAVTDKTLGELRSDRETRATVEAAMREIVAVAAARGVALAPDVVERTMAFLDTLPAAGTTSMQRDLLEGRPSELEAQNGAVVRLGAAAGVSTPVHSAIYERLRPLEARHRALGA